MIINEIPKDIAQQIITEDIEGWKVISTQITSQGRWSTYKEAIVQHIDSNKFYKVNYSVGSTECQEQDMFHNDPVKFIEVIQQDVIVKQWVNA